MKERKENIGRKEKKKKGKWKKETKKERLEKEKKGHRIGKSVLLFKENTEKATRTHPHMSRTVNQLKNGFVARCGDSAWAVGASGGGANRQLLGGLAPSDGRCLCSHTGPQWGWVQRPCSRAAALVLAPTSAQDQDQAGAGPWTAAARRLALLLGAVNTDPLLHDL